MSGRDQYQGFLKLLKVKKGNTSLADRKYFAAEAFKTSSNYDTVIFKYFNRNAGIAAFRESINSLYSLRYGENPHQKGIFFGDQEKLFDKLQVRRFHIITFLILMLHLALSMSSMKRLI